jgi:phosphinothricin acetyltransferase
MSTAINLCIAKSTHCAGMLDIYRPFIESGWTSFETEVPSEVDFLTRVEKTLVQFPWLVATDKQNEVVGYAYGGAHRSRAAYQWNSELSVYVHPEWRKKGVARHLYIVLMHILIEQGYVNFLAGITLPNDASVAFHEKLGFEKIGIYRNIGYKMGQYRDVGWWSLFVGNPNKKPEKPTPFPEMPTETIQKIINQYL